MKKKTHFFIIILALILVNLAVFLLSKHMIKNPTGNFIKNIPGISDKLNISLMAFILQWILLIFIGIMFILRHTKHKKEERKIAKIHLKELSGKSSTDLDQLLDLVNKMPLKVKLAAKKFGVKPEKILEWAKILEDHGLVKIEYPMFSDIIIRKKEENKKENEKEIDKTKKEELNKKIKRKKPKTVKKKIKNKKITIKKHS